MNEISSEKKGGYAEAAYLIKQQRAKDIPFFFFFGGGSIGPSQLSSFDRGSHTIDLLNAIEPDVMAITKRDFIFFEDELSLRSYEAAFPFVTTNVIDKETNQSLSGLQQSVVTQQGNYRIGVLSTMTPNAIGEYNLKRITVTDKIAAVKSEAKKLRAKNVDLIILMHSSRENDVISLLDDGTVDLVLQKNMHTPIIQNQKEFNNSRYIVVNNIDQFALINLSGIKSKNLSVDTKLYFYKDLDKDARMQRKVDQYKARLSSLLDEVIGIVEAPMNTRRNVVRQQESAFANLITDALREYSDADIALINGGAIRGETTYEVGQMMNRRHVISELPYRTHILLLNISGKQIHQAIEHGLAGVDKVLGQFLHVSSGLVVTYDNNLAKGNRVLSIKHNGVNLIPNKMYRVAMSDYLASGGDNFTMWQNAEEFEYSRQKNMLISNIVINYIREKRVISPKIEYRLVDKTQVN